MRVSYDEAIKIIAEKGLDEAANQIKEVVLGTYQLVQNCTLNFSIDKHFDGIKPVRFFINKIPIYLGLGSDNYLLGGNLPQYDDALNSHYPGDFRNGSGHLLENLLLGKHVDVVAFGYVTDLHPKQRIKTTLTLKDFNDTFFNVLIPSTKKVYGFINSSNSTMYSDLGVIKENSLTINYGTNGFFELMSSLPNIGNIKESFIGGAKGEVYKNKNYIFLTADFKDFNPYYFQGASLAGFGVGAFIGMGVVYPIKSKHCLEIISQNETRKFEIFDIARDKELVGNVTYQELKNEYVSLNDMRIKTNSIISHQRINKIYSELI